MTDTLTALLKDIENWLIQYGKHAKGPAEANPLLVRSRAALVAQQHTWRCFGCGQVFTDEAVASIHFGEEGAEALCVEWAKDTDAERRQKYEQNERDVMRLQDELLDAKAKLVAQQQDIEKLQSNWVYQFDIMHKRAEQAEAALASRPDLTARLREIANEMWAAGTARGCLDETTRAALLGWHERLVLLAAAASPQPQEEWTAEEILTELVAQLGCEPDEVLETVQRLQWSNGLGPVGAAPLPAAPHEVDDLLHIADWRECNGVGPEAEPQAVPPLLGRIREAVKHYGDYQHSITRSLVPLLIEASTELQRCWNADPSPSAQSSAPARDTEPAAHQTGQP